MLVNIGHFVISCNIRDINFVHKDKNTGTILEEKK